MTKRRTRKKWTSRLRRMGLPHDLARYAPRWSAALEVAEGVAAITREVEERLLWNSTPWITWSTKPTSFESPWRVGLGYAQIDPDAHINNLVILKHPLDRDEDGSEVPLTTPRKPSTFGE